MKSQPVTCGVLGAAGFVGSAVVYEARQRGCSVTPIDLQEYEAAKGMTGQDASGSEAELCVKELHRRFFETDRAAA